jgi:hypothetical protein
VSFFGAALFASLSRARTKLENDGERTLRRAPSVVVVVLRRIRDGC